LCSLFKSIIKNKSIRSKSILDSISVRVRVFCLFLPGCGRTVSNAQEEGICPNSVNFELLMDPELKC
jgi:hypothetical protein